MLPRSPDARREVAIALPVKDEEDDLPACLAALDAAAGRHAGPVFIVAFANDCTDDSIALLRRWRPRHACLIWRAVSLLPGSRHAGWARRLAFDAAADLLGDDRAVLLSTDADTQVAPDWIDRTIAHIDAGADAVAGRALTRRADRRALGKRALRRLNQLGRYYTALDYLRAARAPEQHDSWPRHYYEGGASIALTLGLYRRIGGAPTPSVAEDRALFDRVRAHGGRVRHPLDVRVFTSCRIAGRAPGGMADTLARWIMQPETERLHETYAVAAALDPARAGEEDQLTFRTLPHAIAEARRLIRRTRAGSTPSPQIEPILLPPIGANDGDRVAETFRQPGNGIVPALGIVGFAQPVDEQDMAAGTHGARQPGR